MWFKGTFLVILCCTSYITCRYFRIAELHFPNVFVVVVVVVLSFCFIFISYFVFTKIKRNISSFGQPIYMYGFIRKGSLSASREPNFGSKPLTYPFRGPYCKLQTWIYGPTEREVGREKREAITYRMDQEVNRARGKQN